DLRFVQHGELVPYEIERWDPTDRSFVWVRLNTLAIEEEPLFAAFGNPAAVDAQDPGDVWLGYAGVWHFAQAPSSGALLDSTVHRNHGAFRGGMTDTDLVIGQIGSGLRFEGVDDFVEI